MIFFTYVFLSGYKGSLNCPDRFKPVIFFRSNDFGFNRDPDPDPECRMTWTGPDPEC